MKTMMMKALLNLGATMVATAALAVSTAGATDLDGFGHHSRRGRSRACGYSFDANGLYIGTQEVDRKSTLSDDGKTLSSTAKVRIVDMNGVLLVQGCATEEGRRF